MNILVVSHLYPSSFSPVRGIFVQREIDELIEALDYRVTLLTPIPWAPRVLWWRIKWRSYGQEPMMTSRTRLTRYCPRYMILPRQILRAFTGYTLYFAIRRFVEKLHCIEKFHVIHAHTLIPDGYAALRIGRKLGIPVVCTSHGADTNVYPSSMYRYRKLASEVVSQVDQLIAVSTALRTDLQGLATPLRPIRIIPNSVDIAKFSHDQEKRAALRHSLGIPQRAVLLAFLGSIFREKGVYELLDAFRALAQQKPDLHLILIGQGIDFPDVHNIVTSDPNLERVTLVGQILPDAVPGFLSASDIFVLPSYHEGMPCAIVEAMSCGLPIVATRVGGIPDIVQDGKTGLLINPKDSASLADALFLLCENVEFRMGLGNNARQYAGEHLSWRLHTDMVRAVYRDLLEV